MNMFISFNYYNISLLLGGTLALFNGIFVLAQSLNKKENQIWFGLTIATTCWGLGYFLMINTPIRGTAHYADIFLHFAAISIPIIYILFVLKITDNYLIYKNYLPLFYGAATFFLIITPTNYFLLPEIHKTIFTYTPAPGPLYIYFFLYFLFIVFSGICIILKKIKQETDLFKKKRYRLIVLFTLLAAFGGGSVFITTFFPSIPPYLLGLFLIYPIISAYTIYKHNLFNIKFIGIEMIILCLWFITVIRMFFSINIVDHISNTILLIISIFFGVVLIRCISNEISNREKIEILALELERTNARLVELDKRKTDFLSFASHQLRGPLTIMKGYGSYILGKDLKKVPSYIKDAIEKIDTSADSMNILVNEYLNIVQIEQNAVSYNLTNFDIKDLLEAVFNEWRSHIDDLNIKLNWSVTSNTIHTIQGDSEKLRQVFYNLFDNAIKYTKQGSIVLSLEKINGKIRIILQDSGIGIDSDVMPHLFEKFTRSSDAQKSNHLGTGLGLYVAKKIIEAHNGKIWAESEGADKGSTFFIELKAA